MFWFLVIIGAVLLGAMGGFLPETARNVVGNGSMKATRWRERNWGALVWDWILRGSRKRIIRKIPAGSVSENKSNEAEGEIIASSVNESASRAKRRFKVLNPLSCLRIIFWKDAACILWLHASFSLVDYSIQKSIPPPYKNIRGFNELEIGLSYLPRGVGKILGGYVNGRMMDRNYKIMAKQLGHTID